MIVIIGLVCFIAGFACGMVMEAVLERNERDRQVMDERIRMASE